MDLEMKLEMDLETVIFNKDGISLIRKYNKYNKYYTLEFFIENNNIELDKIIDFNLAKLIYSLNTDIFEKINLEEINTNENVITILIKHFFEDIGFPQYFCNINVTKIIEDNCILFKLKTNIERPDNICEEIKQMNVYNLITKCDIITKHKIKVHSTMEFDKISQIPLWVEKTIGLISNKIIKRLKQFIEKMIL